MQSILNRKFQAVNIHTSTTTSSMVNLAVIELIADKDKTVILFDNDSYFSFYNQSTSEIQDNGHILRIIFKDN